MKLYTRHRKEKKLKKEALKKPEPEKTEPKKPVKILDASGKVVKVLR